MAVRAFLQEKVDVAIIEVGIGGEYVPTNVVSRIHVFIINLFLNPLDFREKILLLSMNGPRTPLGQDILTADYRVLERCLPEPTIVYASNLIFDIPKRTGKPLVQAEQQSGIRKGKTTGEPSQRGTQSVLNDGEQNPSEPVSDFFE
ncbi:hypothetical protein HHI36_013174 [Cryptolaemus montrouzieri]|uniref:Uncharacterized protein n=1 Tax=Cryptolaemus montrouzieri TaxID=559131 RepID=A0ABD2NHF2_9CUCU